MYLQILRILLEKGTMSMEMKALLNLKKKTTYLFDIIPSDVIDLTAHYVGTAMIQQ